jgi:uncharacterized OB-fold protein
MNAYAKPLPKPTALSLPFWQAARQQQIKVQRCNKCGHTQHPPRPLCGECWSDDLAWITCKGRGKVFSYTICRWPTIAAFKDDAPYVIAIVELVEGVRLTTNIVDCPMDSVAIDMEVEAVFEKATDEITLIKFKPVGT